MAAATTVGAAGVGGKDKNSGAVALPALAASPSKRGSVGALGMNSTQSGRPLQPLSLPPVRPVRNAILGTRSTALAFSDLTTAQKRRAAVPPDLILQPLAVLNAYQHDNSREYIQRLAFEKYESERFYEKIAARRKKEMAKIRKLAADSTPEEAELMSEKRPTSPHESEISAESGDASRAKRRYQLEALEDQPRGRFVAWGPTQPPREKPIVDPGAFSGMHDMLEVIELLKRRPELGFLYLSPAADKYHVDYFYYHLQVVPYERIFPPDYATISLKGVTRIRSDDETDFISLERFEDECRHFHRLRNIKAFKLFRQWKQFIVWRKNVLFTKIEKYKKILNENLFILDPSLRPALLNVREMCYRISDMGLCRVEKNRTYSLDDFANVQFVQLREVTERLSEFRDLVKEVIRSACRTALLEAGFTPDDYFIDVADSAKLGHSPMDRAGAESPPQTGSSYLDEGYDIDIYGLAPDKMTYTEQANKRGHCRRLTCFIRLSDYLVVHTMHSLAVNSVSTLLNHLIEQLQNTPVFSVIKEWMEEILNPPKPPEEEEEAAAAAAAAAGKGGQAGEKGGQQKRPSSKTTPKKPEQKVLVAGVDEEAEEEKKLAPLFLTQFVLEVEQLRFSPGLEEFHSRLDQVIGQFEGAVLSVRNLTPDPFFDAFTRPIINNKFEDKTCGDGPALQSIFDEDRNLSTIIHDIKEAVQSAFNVSQQYADTYKPIHAFYRENEAENLDAMKAHPHDVPWFLEALTRYTNEQAIVARMKEQRNVGMLLVDGKAMKELLIPNPLRCLEAVWEMLPRLSRKECDRLLAELQDAQYRLEVQPSSTLDYVDALTFLDKIQQRIEPLEAEADIVKEMYELIDKFKVPTPPEDFAVYQSLRPAINTTKNAVDKALGDRDQNVDKLSKKLDKDIEDLNRDVRELKKEAQVPMLLDLGAERDKVYALLGKLQSQMSELQKLAFTYKAYQKNFKLEQTRFDELEETNSELKLKQLLWDSMREWDDLVAEWLVSILDQLEPEVLTNNTQKYAKYVYQLEKGLPPNVIVPDLKRKVEAMKERLPTVGDLRNPTLKPRHWEKLEELIGLSFLNASPEDPVTLRKLIEVGAFSHNERIQEISAQASSEAGLEALLKKVEEAWKNTEFVVIRHKDYKDVFILGGTDEIQQLLDDSNINISTIASSRYVGPIKARVDDWQRQLDLFNKTLDCWLNCQRNWLYLESIFSAPDIQRQLPAEAKMFMTVDKSFKEIMRKVNKMPLAIRAATQPGLLETFQNNNALLEKITKCLEAYLESKRVIFPRFYFLSNDELLEILAQTRNPLAVQPHLRKCFDSIAKLEFGTVLVGVGEKEKSDMQAAGGQPGGAPPAEGGHKTPGAPQGTGGEEGGEGGAVAAPAVASEIQFTNDIHAMLSPENERVSLGKGLKARGNVEEWLGKVEEAMFVNLRKVMKLAMADFERVEREKWLLSWPSQIVLAVDQMMWTRDITEILTADFERSDALKDYEKQSFENLSKLATIVRGELPKLARAVLCALITIDVHARDVVSDMVRAGVADVNSFDWLKQLRYYWDYEIDNCIVRMSNSQYLYGYEYLGASTRLVITPLTDRCYLCLMGALQQDLGGSPAGPAGTGKTESVKDLSKAIARQCVVFNCSDGLDYKMMGKFFSGLAQSGAWCCFDEFNRIDIEVLSVIAQQLITIRNAKAGKLSRFMFEGREIKLSPTCATFITMNPGYAGRTELPDNLKALFRPISMMVPDYKLIAEVILYSEGFESSKHLAQKMTQMYKLCSEQLSQQDHYDFGMRAVKSVLVMAGALKRSNPDKSEDVVLIRALRDSNLPKFLQNDVLLFQAILQDLFPGVELPEHDYGILAAEIKRVLAKRGLQVVDSQVDKVIQFYETMVVRHGVMLVGPTGGGKTTVYRALSDVLTNLNAAGHASKNAFYQPVHTYIMNPKAITMGELYGEVNKLTLEWHDGLMPFVVRVCTQDTTEDHQWIVCDSPVDALWIENMNSVLDDNKLLCLANSERIKFTPFMHMIFEVQDLAVASPATVSRCGMVYLDPADLGWMPYVQTWMAENSSKFQPETVEYILALFTRYVEDGLTFTSKKCIQPIVQVPLAKVQTLCRLLDSLVLGKGSSTGGMNLLQTDLQKLHPLLCTTFVFCYLWSIGGNTADTNWDSFDNFIRQQFEDNGDARMPQSGDLWGCYVDLEARRMDSWERIIPLWRYSKEVPYFEILVPTVDTVRFGYLFTKLVQTGRSVIFTGGTGVGKSVIARGTLLSMGQKGNFLPLFVNFSAQTTSGRTQEIVEGKLEKRRKNIIGAPTGKVMVIFVDDLNMPKLDRYGAQPPIELLRQVQDFHGFYDRDKLFWKEIQDVIICAACAPPGGGRNAVTPRLVRHFSMFCLPSPSEHSLKQMFTAILQGFLADFPPTLRQMAESMVGASVELYSRMCAEFLPTPTKSHYLFNLRDLSKCVQGILQGDPGTIRDPRQMFRLFVHESQRVFHDRLTTEEDKVAFHGITADLAGKYFGEQNIEAAYFVHNPIIFGDFIKLGAAKEDRLYEDLSAEIKKLQAVLRDYLDEYNMNSSKEMKLVFFIDAIQHVSRLSRILRQDRGNALLVGVGGTGKQSLTRLASSINGMTCVQIELTRNYDYNSFHDDLKKLYHISGPQNKKAVFLFTDMQIVVEEFLEDINNILNSGEVPNLFPPDEYEQLIVACRPDAQAAGIAEGNRDAIYQFCINRVRNNLHVVLCMSPVGSAFRSRCRQFPSLVNCCTIDWFTEWPAEALLGVAQSLFELVDLGDEALKPKMADMCVFVHTSVADMATRFYEELKRRYYTTPTSYLELINLYLSMLSEKKKQLTQARDRVKNGLTKLLQTNELVANMEKELVALEPVLKQKSIDTNNLMERLAVDQEKADAVRRVVKEDEAVANVKAEETKAIADDAQRDLNEALPALEASIKSLDALDKNDIAELRVFTKPPELVQTVMEAVCLLLGAKTDWAAAKLLLSDANFLRSLYEYDKDNVSDATLKKLKKYTDNPKFTPDQVEKVSKACKSMCMWVKAIDVYGHVFRTVKPKRERLAAAQAELNSVMAVLNEKRAKLKAVEDQIAALQRSYDESVEEKRRLEQQMQLTQARLKRAGRLQSSLGDEQVRWVATVDEMNGQISSVVGNVFLASACVAYCGAFTSSYRAELVTQWVSHCQELSIPVQESFQLAAVLADPYEIRQWNTDGLPRDQLSIENAILVTRGRRWPLMIDPQEQANRWIKNKEMRNGLKVVKPSSSGFMRTLESCIRIGIPVLLEEAGESLDPALEPVLLKQTFLSGGRLMIRLGDSDVEYDKNFRFYITTKLSNPHYLPEICIKVTIINFTVTRSGLEDQILGEVVRLERPELEQQRNELIVKINTDKNQLKSIEDRILKLLYESEGNILDNVDLINTLNESKITSVAIMERLADAEVTEKKITEARNKYIPVSERGAAMYFVVASMAEVDPMYQFSLKYFKTLFNSTIETSEKADELEKRIKIILDETAITIYKNVARGLFEKDKLVFSFLLCIEIMKLAGTVLPEEWVLFTRGLGAMDKQRPKKPDHEFISLRNWNMSYDLHESFSIFRGLHRELISTPIWVQIGSLKVEFNPSTSDTYVEVPEFDPTFIRSINDEAVVGHWQERLTDFQKLMLIRFLAEEKLVPAVQQFVASNLGTLFIQPPRTDLPSLYADISATVPLVFILSTGSDPMGAFLRFAREKGYAERVHAISLGQGQGPVAEKLIGHSRRTGDWVILQNCHLASSWMSSLEEIVKMLGEATPSLPSSSSMGGSLSKQGRGGAEASTLSTASRKEGDEAAGQEGAATESAGGAEAEPELDARFVHENFRLFLTSMPSRGFPVLVLQNSVKVTNEPPKGLRTNIARSFQELTTSYFDTHILQTQWRRMVFGICFFHGVILERKKFGPLGWNIKYEFNDSDREAALATLTMFTTEGVIKWDALEYITGLITYGGRVTDAWDQRCLSAILRRFFAPNTLAPDYKYSASGVYYAPVLDSLEEYREFILELPLLDEPEIFGMHENANIAFQLQESGSFLSTVVDMQPRAMQGKGAKSNDETVNELIDTIEGKLVPKIDIELAKPDLFDLDPKGRMNSLSTVLVQEIDRYNKLLRVILESLSQLRKAIKGLVVMSENLEQVYTAFLNNQVPRLWGEAAYPSLKTLAPWVRNLVFRLNFIDMWMKRGMPKSFWLSGFFFPQGFLTGTLQNYARKYNQPIDHLSFEFHMLEQYRDQEVVDKAMLELGFGEEMELDKQIDRPVDGVLVHGLFTDGFRWSDSLACMEDSRPGEMISVLPLMHMLPCMDYEPEKRDYTAPLYKTSVRAGVLSTTGHSTNFVVGVSLPSTQTSDYWILKGAALVCEKRE